MGLLDGLNTDEGRLGMALLAAAGPQAQPMSFGQRLSGAMGNYQAGLDQREDRKAKEEERRMRAEMMMLQVQQIKQAQAEKIAAEQKAAERQRTMGNYFGSINANAGPAREFNAAEAFAAGVPAEFMQYLAPKERKPLVSKPGDIARDPVTGATLWENKAAPDKGPTAVQEYEFAKAQGYGGTFEQWKMADAKARGTNITMPKIEMKTGESLGGQVGPMAKDSKIKVGGAITMFDAADRIEKALDSNQVTSGPLASKIQTVRQLAQVVGGGDDTKIRQTQQVIRSLAKMAVEARKQLQGQGQVTENEAKAVERADGGDLDSLTTGELRDLVVLTKRASHYAAAEHTDILKAMEASEATRGLIPFFSVRGMEPLLQFKPELPRIPANGGSARDAADRIINGGR